MAKRRTLRVTLGEVRIRGSQRSQLEADLLAQIVVMLGRQLSTEDGSDSGHGAAGRASEDVTRDADEETGL